MTSARPGPPDRERTTWLLMLSFFALGLIWLGSSFFDRDNTAADQAEADAAAAAQAAADQAEADAAAAVTDPARQDRFTTRSLHHLGVGRHHHPRPRRRSCRYRRRKLRLHSPICAGPKPHCQSRLLDLSP